jgi:hypothetical protein
MTMPDPVGPQRDDSPTTPVELPPFPSVQPAAGPALPQSGATPSGATPPAGAAPWDVSGPIPPAGPWDTPWDPATASAPGPGPAPAPAAAPPPGPGPAPGLALSAQAPETGPSGYAAPPPQPAGVRPPAQAQTPPGLVAGIVLVVIGVAFLLIRVADMALGAGAWPLWLIVPGLAMLAGSLAIPPRAGLGLAIPGTIIAIVGAILWVQEAYGLYATWAYAWALVAPTGPGLAMLIYGLARGDHELAADGFRTFLVGIGLFLGFALFFEGVIGISGHRIANLDEVLPYILVGFGVLLVVASLFGGRRNRRDRRDQGGASGA